MCVGICSLCATHSVVGIDRVITFLASDEISLVCRCATALAEYRADLYLRNSNESVFVRQTFSRPCVAYIVFSHRPAVAFGQVADR